jgi:hypothetical protein
VSIVVDITELSQMMEAAGVTVGAVLTLLKLRHLVKQRQAGLVMRLCSTLEFQNYRKLQ